MLLKPGELAKRSGLTIRTLHYYHQIALLVPSARSAAGYRLYSREDVSRLHRIQALRRLGVSLAEIQAVLDRPSSALTPLIAQQLTALDRQLAEITALRGRLLTLHQQLQAGKDPELNDWLTTLEMMTMYDNYFTADELHQLPFCQPDAAREAEWREMVTQVQALMAAEVAAEADDAQQLARRWMRCLERDTGGNPQFLAKLNAMHEEQPAMRELSGITPAIMAYITRAFAESKLQIYRRYLDDSEYAYVRAHYFDRINEWPELIARFKTAMEQQVAAESPQAAALARRWLELFHSWAGDNPATQQKIRTAMEQQPTLTEGTWLTPALLDYLRTAIAALFSSPGRQS